MVAIAAAARRLERKGLVTKGSHWYVTTAGKQFLKAIDSDADLTLIYRGPWR